MTPPATHTTNVLDPAKVVEHAYGYPYAWEGADNCSPGHYADIKHATSWILGATLEARFNGDAVYNGSNY